MRRARVTRPRLLHGRSRVEISGQEEVHSLCARHPLALPVLRTFDVDLSNNARTLEACCLDHVDLAVAIAAIEAAEVALAASWRGCAVRELLDHISRTYHRSLPQELAGMKAALESASKLSHHREWAVVIDQLSELGVDLEQHVELEDRVVFPWLRRGATASPVSIRAIELDNADAISRIRELAARISGCLAADGDNLQHREVVAHLGRFERWLCEHIHFECNELFPRALQKEAGRR